eukprot:c28059_g1_i1 orf=15-227(+)
MQNMLVMLKLLRNFLIYACLAEFVFFATEKNLSIKTTPRAPTPRQNTERDYNRGKILKGITEKIGKGNPG